VTDKTDGRSAVPALRDRGLAAAIPIAITIAQDIFVWQAKRMTIAGYSWARLFDDGK